MNRLRPVERAGWLLVVALACGLRCWGLDFGLPGVAHDDEWQYVATAASCLERGSVTIQTDPPEEAYINPTGFTFVSAAAVLPLDLRLRGGELEGTRARYRAHRGRYHLAARWASALFGVLAVVLVGLLGRRQLGARGGLLAAALLAVSPLHVRDAHFAVGDVTATTLMLGALVAWRWRRDPRGAALAGALLGAATGTKYSMGLLLPALALDVGLAPAPRAERVRRLLLLALGGALGFLIAFPAALLDLPLFLKGFRYQASLGGAPWPGQDPGPTPWLHLRTLWLALGPVGLGLAAAGWVRLARAREWALAGYPALHLLAFLPLPLFFARFDLPLLPCLALAAGAALQRVRRRAWAVALAAACLAPPALTATRIDAVLAQPDTRLDLRAWLDEQLPAAGQPPLRLAVDAGGVRWLLDDQGRFHAGFDVTHLRALPGVDVARLEALLREQADLVVLTSAYGDADPTLRALHERLRASATLALEVHAGPTPIPVAQGERYGPWDHAWSRRRPGPSVWVYRL